MKLGYQYITLTLLMFHAFVNAQEQNSPIAEKPALEIPAPPLDERLYGLSLLWSETKFSFAFFDQVPDLDWDAEYQKYITRVEQTETLYQYYRELQSFMALLSDGHTGVSMPQEIKVDIAPVWVEVIEDKYYISRTNRQLVDQVPLGSEVISVRGMPVREYVKSEVAPYIGQSSPQARDMYQSGYLLSGITGEKVDFTIVTPEGEQRESSVIANYFYGPDVEPVPAIPSSEMKVEWFDNKIAKVNLSTFADKTVPDRFESLIPELVNADAIILDLRTNGGGMTGVGSAVLSHFTDQNLAGSKWSTRKHLAAHRVWGSYGSGPNKVYADLNAWTEPEFMPEIKVSKTGQLADKPVAVLTSTKTASAAEDFLIYADPLENMTRIGQPTFGSTGQPLSLKLPGGGYARICTKRDTWQDGTDFVGVGVEPEIYVARSVENIISGKDTTLDVAIEYLNSKLN